MFVKNVKSHVIRTLAVVAAAVVSCSAADLGERIRKIIEETAEARQCFWGIRVTDAESGKVLYSYNEDKFFVPASNTKLFTTSLALRSLGPDYKFRTRVEIPSGSIVNGKVSELRLIGGGDPNLSARLLPYNKQEQGADALAAIRALADRVVAQGVRRVEGDIVGDDSAFLWEPFPDGWSVDDPVYEYGAPVSALTLNDNAFRLTVLPGAAAGAPASLTLNPPLEYLTVHNRTKTVETGPARIRFDRIPGSKELVVTGTVLLGAPSGTFLLAIDDPALFAASALKTALEQRGVEILGGARSVHRSAEGDMPEWKGTEIAVIESAPLSQVLQVVNKVSQNLHTEILLREIARVKTGVGSRRQGLEELARYLQETGVAEGQWNFADASGLSRLTLVTPLTLSKLLCDMYRTPLRDVWMATLPVGGVDGTLEKRFQQSSAGQRIHAKTGSLSHVAALSGYAVREDGHTWVFSVIANNYNASHSAIRPVIDKLALALLD